LAPRRSQFEASLPVIHFGRGAGSQMPNLDSSKTAKCPKGSSEVGLDGGLVVARPVVQITTDSG